jgi:hypothetical protein
MKTRTFAAATAVVLLMLCPTYAMPDEKNITPDILIMPYPLSMEQKIANELSTPRFPMSKEQKVREELGVIASFAFIDYNQSVTMFYKNEGYYELNPVLGPKPSRGGMIAFGVIGTGLFYLLANNLSEPWRQVVVDSIIASERMNIEDNRRVYPGWNTDGPPLRGRIFNGVPLVISLRF